MEFLREEIRIISKEQKQSPEKKEGSNEDAEENSPEKP